MALHRKKEGIGIRFLPFVVISISIYLITPSGQ